MKEVEVDVLGVIYKGFLEKFGDLNTSKLEENFLKTLNEKQRQDYGNLKLIFKSDSLAGIKDAIKYTLKFVSDINTFEKDKTKVYFD